MHRLIAAVLLIAAVPALAQLVPEGAMVEKVADGYRFTEGPAAGPDGCIYFTDIPAELILKYDPESGETVTFRENTGRANGLMWFKGDLYMCCHEARAVRLYPLNPNWYEEVDRSGQAFPSDPLDYHPTKPVVLFETWAESVELFNGQDRKQFRFNSPNDLAIDKSGYIYFTDPRYGNRDSMELETEGVYSSILFPRFINDRIVSPHTELIDAELERPNGIVLSPDESILYVADHGANWIYAYDIVEPGKVENKRRFAQLNDGEGRGSDGMCVDPKGRVYATGHGKVWVFEPSGELVTTIDVGPQTTNCTFAQDGRTLYVTANRGLYRIKLNTGAPTRIQGMSDEVDVTSALPVGLSPNMATAIMPNKDGEQWTVARGEQELRRLIEGGGRQSRMEQIWSPAGTALVRVKFNPEGNQSLHGQARALARNLQTIVMTDGQEQFGLIGVFLLRADQSGYIRVREGQQTVASLPRPGPEDELYLYFEVPVSKTVTALQIGEEVYEFQGALTVEALTE